MKQQIKYDVSNTIASPETGCDMLIRMLPSRDGVRIHTAIYFPEDFDRNHSAAPVLLIRTPYCSPDRLLLPDSRVAADKIIYIVQSCRGTGFSEGEFDPIDPETEKSDVESLFLWLAKQPWFNGRCAMFGGSYTGYAQWCAAQTGFDGLVAIAPYVAPIYGTGCFFKNGINRHELSINWLFNLYHRRHCGFNSALPDYEDGGAMAHMPLTTTDQQAGYELIENYQKVVGCMDEPGKIVGDYPEIFRQMKVPAFISGGWFDPFKDETIESFMLLKKSAAGSLARQLTRLYIGPWEHAGLINKDLFPNGGNQEFLAAERAFLKNMMMAPDVDPLPEMPVVRYYMLGENQWHNSDCWPPDGVEYQKMYIHSAGNANSSAGAGKLDFLPPDNEIPDSYISDPADPVGSCGGKAVALGCYDRSEDEKRMDMLVYTSAPATEDMVITGGIKFHFHSTVSTPDTDFCAVLTLLTPEGKSLFMTWGATRARFRKSLSEPELLIPGKEYEFVIDLSHIALTVKPGYALRLELCGQYFPYAGRNNNTGKSLKDDRELQSSRHVIFHDSDHPAFLELPLIKK